MEQSLRLAMGYLNRKLIIITDFCILSLTTNKRLEDLNNGEGNIFLACLTFLNYNEWISLWDMYTPMQQHIKRADVIL